MKIVPGSQTEMLFKKEYRETTEMKYLIYLPSDYDEKVKQWPLMLFLHGAGERGEDINKVKVHGPPKLVENGENFPFIVISPQCPKEQWWPSLTAELMRLIDEISQNYAVDEKRIYLTGLSMGGYGTWALAGEFPDKFAAIAPVCGGGTPYFARKMRHIPAWVFHGAQDQVVPLKNSEEMVLALRKAGGEVKFTVYPEAGHDSWTETYNNPEFYEWFLQFERGK
ncbi:MAG: phospholipase [Calditrichaeota bacterium]|nr:MAG: phospholipase [Calditrichota bacterium]